MAGYVTGFPKVLLVSEAVVELAAAVLAYAASGASWWLFALFFAVPDISMLGYLGGRRLGASVYNMGHWYGFPAASICLGVFGHLPLALHIGLIWAAHIAFDRAIMAGLKYPDGFRSNHLGFVGVKRGQPSSQV